MKRTRRRELLSESFDSLCEYARASHGFNVYTSWETCSGYCDFSNKEIVINSSLGIEKKVYILIHEIGHVLVRRNREKYRESFPAHAEATSDGRVTRSKKFKVSTVEEEFEAWRRGKRAAKRLSVYFDERKLESFKTECLMSYMFWTCQ